MDQFVPNGAAAMLQRIGLFEVVDSLLKAVLLQMNGADPLEELWVL